MDSSLASRLVISPSCAAVTFAQLATRAAAVIASAIALVRPQTRSGAVVALVVAEAVPFPTLLIAKTR